MEINDFLKKAADKIGFVRERFDGNRIPTDYDSLLVIPFFGDWRGLFALSSYLLPRWKEMFHSSKYVILASWSGCQSLFPYVGEYWGLKDDGQSSKMFSQADLFRNLSDSYTIVVRNLNEHFRSLFDRRDVCDPYWELGFTQRFWDEYKEFERFLPGVMSSAMLGRDFSREMASRGGYKVFLSPSQYAEGWKHGRTEMMSVSKDFWKVFVGGLIDGGFVPVLWQNFAAYDLSPEFAEKCLYVVGNDMNKAMSAMRASHCVLDVFNGMSKLALAAKAPFMAFDESSRYGSRKEWEIDDLCGWNLPQEYIFGFSTTIAAGSARAWLNDFAEPVCARLKTFLPSFDRDSLPPTMESREVVSCERIRVIKNKKIGTRLIKVDRD